MKFLYAFAGIPEALFDGIEVEKEFVVRVDGEFFGVPRESRCYGYDDAYLELFEREFVGRVERDVDNRLAETAFALIYISYGERHDRLVERMFYPSILTIPVPWTFIHGTPAEVRRQKNELLKQLELATRNAKRALSALQDETTRYNSTPLLLPMKSFSSNHLSAALAALHREILIAGDKAAAVNAFVRDVKHRHPPKEFPKVGYYKKRIQCFVDEKGVYFKPPGNDKHALLREAGDKHPNACVLSARRRLGAAYEMRFHYDCQIPGVPKWSVSLEGCHAPTGPMTGEPHINIAPNDFARA